MAIFAVLSQTPGPEFGHMIGHLFPRGASLELSDTQWLIATEGDPEELAIKLDIPSGKYGRVLVLLATSSASGTEPKSVWDWLEKKSKETE